MDLFRVVAQRVVVGLHGVGRGGFRVGVIVDIGRVDIKGSCRDGIAGRYVSCGGTTTIFGLLGLISAWCGAFVHIVVDIVNIAGVGTA